MLGMLGDICDVKSVEGGVVCACFRYWTRRLISPTSRNDPAFRRHDVWSELYVFVVDLMHAECEMLFSGY
jgi:hypothetical protein